MEFSPISPTKDSMTFSMDLSQFSWLGRSFREQDDTTEWTQSANAGPNRHNQDGESGKAGLGARRSIGVALMRGLRTSDIILGSQF